MSDGEDNIKNPKCPKCGHEAPPPFVGKKVIVPMKESIEERYSLTCPECGNGFLYPEVTDEDIFGKKDLDNK